MGDHFSSDVLKKNFSDSSEILAPKVSMNNKKEILNFSKISLVLNNYNDIFSSFDPRDYDQRALSADFLDELKRATRDKTSGLIEMNLMIPAKLKNSNNENLMRKRMKDHFRKHFLQLSSESRKIKIKGYGLALIGIAMIVAASYMDYLGIRSFLGNLITVILEPGGWFLGWTGLDQLFYTLQEQKEDLIFYEKMSRGEIVFISY